MDKTGKKIILLLLVSVCVLLTACQKKDPNEGKTRYSIYYLNREETKIAEFAYYSESQEPIKVLGELLALLSQTPENMNYNETIRDFLVTAYSINDDVVHITVDEHYRKMSATTEVLTRAAIVRTLSQIKGINYVTMKIDDNELTDSLGVVIGAMTADQFVDNAGNEINTYENVELTLYFASANGKYLIKALRPVEYNSNISLERVVVEQLIKGPSGEGFYPTINPNTKIQNVTVKDNICYVNLNEDFLTQQSNITPQVTIYSIVNSLIELDSVNKVQLSIAGNNNILFRDTFELTTLFERNLDILKPVEEESGSEL